MSGIIKAAVAREAVAARHTVAFNFDDLSARANDYLAKIRNEAAQIVADAKQQAAAARKQAEQQGRQAAMQAAERVLDEKVGQQMKSLLPAVAQAIDRIEAARHDWLAHWEANVVRLAEAIAARLVRRELSQHPEITLSLVKEALSLAAGSPQLRLRLNPKDHHALAGQVERLTKEFQRLAPLEIVADPSVSAGGCRLETQFGVIDQQFEAQLARLREELLG
jgi:flagellar assembly protein FliH